MKKSMEVDLGDLNEIVEGFASKLDKLSQAEIIDLAARLKPVAKHCEAIDKHVKEFVKKQLKHKEGVLAGGMFRAVLKLVNIVRLDQKAFKEHEPAMYTEYTRDDTDERVTFEVR